MSEEAVAGRFSCADEEKRHLLINLPTALLRSSYLECAGKLACSRGRSPAELAASHPL